VTVSEIKGDGELDDGLVKAIRELGVKLEMGGHNLQTFESSDMIVVSPGVPLDIEPLKAARKRGIPVIGEMALAVRLIDAPVVAVTGTNGKSTTTALVGSIIENAGLRVFVGGNIGTPLIDYVSGDWKADYVVVEVSSFQLDTMESFRPAVSILLNISPDHLDRYPSYDAYVQSKLKISRNQGAGQHAILNDDDGVLSKFEPAGNVTVLRYGLEKKENRQAFIEGNRLIASFPGKEDLHFDLDRFGLPGKHNQENLMAAVLAGLAVNIAPGVMEETIEHFKALPHRLELVDRIRGVSFYDDSKATNVEAASKSISSFDRPVVLIAGGRDKGGDYTPLVRAAEGRVRKAILMGESRPLLVKSFEGIIPYSLADNMMDAVSQAFSAAEVGDVVLLAPACSSFDMFSDYRQRGAIFRDAVGRVNHGNGR
jgi:UDP-N-acetylmuramoylalanine--D-glutamate ligase